MAVKTQPPTTCMILYSCHEEAWNEILRYNNACTCKAMRSKSLTGLLLHMAQAPSHSQVPSNGLLVTSLCAAVHGGSLTDDATSGYMYVFRYHSAGQCLFAPGYRHILGRAMQMHTWNPSFCTPLVQKGRRLLLLSCPAG